MASFNPDNPPSTSSERPPEMSAPKPMAAQTPEQAAAAARKRLTANITRNILETAEFIARSSQTLPEAAAEQAQKLDEKIEALCKDLGPSDRLMIADEVRSKIKQLLAGASQEAKSVGEKQQKLMDQKQFEAAQKLLDELTSLNIRQVE
ncbi:hypothetical protein HY633_05015 [Candidatus Uhrbacteria bacterium]|nr:hypothetical protein [Candidatus Uhrbacteria bacterium]